MCKTRMDALPLDKPITVFPMKSFPILKDLVTDVSWNYKVNKKIPPFTPRPGTDWKVYQEDVDRVQEFRKCIECFLCQNVCHVLRDHDKFEQFGSILRSGPYAGAQNSRSRQSLEVGVASRPEWLLARTCGLIYPPGTKTKKYYGGFPPFGPS
jgi:succinate dehydrogenase/fumarate reductase-like Fe-S protein